MVIAPHTHFLSRRVRESRPPSDERGLSVCRAAAESPDCSWMRYEGVTVVEVKYVELLRFSALDSVLLLVLFPDD